MNLCKQFLGDRNNVTDENSPTNEWYNLLSIRSEIKLTDYVYDGSDKIEHIVMK